MKLFIPLFVVIFLPTLASAEVMRCVVKGAEAGWIAKEILFEHDPQQDVVRVADGVIMRFEGQPTPAQITENSDKKLVFNWRIATTNGKGQVTKMSYRLAYFKTNGKVSVSAKPHGYSNNFGARGRCQKINGALPS